MPLDLICVHLSPKSIFIFTSGIGTKLEQKI